MLTWLYNGTGGSILACAVWHSLYNLDTGTAASTSVIQAITTTFVYILAFVLVGLELRTRNGAKRPRPSAQPCPLIRLLRDRASTRKRHSVIPRAG
ncbi:MAG TPA: hypothetical protein VIC05_06015 [Solirubrobacteraceae bacterium]